MNPYIDWVYCANQKIAEKRKKLPFGNFLEQKLFLLYFKTLDKVPSKNQI